MVTNSFQIQNQTIMPLEMGVIHFIGIGGIGMSGIAEILHGLGYKVQGSDIHESYVTDHLKSKNIPIFIGHNASNLENVSLVVKSTAIQDNNIEVVIAKKALIPIIKRSEMLAEVMRFKHCIAVSGTHGKTTTTSLISKMLESAGLCPTVINGGIINEIGSNARLGTGQLLVAEADESDGTFMHIPAFVAVITNMDPEHLDFYGNFNNVKDAYFQFIENLPFYGFGVLCFDHEEVRKLAKRITNRLIISYAIDFQDADLVAYNIRNEAWSMIYDVKISSRLQKHLKINFNKIENIRISMMGEHNLQNSLSAIAISLKLGVKKEIMQQGMANFQGIRRRFSRIAEIDKLTIVDDYAHHPVEIKAALKMARKIADQQKSKVIAIAQPHRYSRLESLIKEFSECFIDADILYIAEVYSAGETPIPDINSKKLVENIKHATEQEVYLLLDHNDIPEIIKNIMKPNDLLIFMGAGDITKWAHKLPTKLISSKQKTCVA